MADISEFNINNTLYNLKDNQARNDILSISSNLDNYLSLSGGTLTGGLTTSLQLIIKDNRLDSSSLGANRWFRHFVIKDNNDEDRGHIELYTYSNGTQGIQLEASRIVNGTPVYNSLGLGIDSEGNTIINLNVPEKWRESLGATNGIWPKNLGGTGNTNGTVDKLTTARTIRTDLALTTTASFDGSANITPGVTGILNIENGGTGQNGKSVFSITRNTTNTSTGTFTAYKWGNIVVIRGIGIQLKAAASGNGTEIGSFSSNRPGNNANACAWGGNASHNGLVWVTTEGKIAAFSPLKAGTNINFTVVYFV